MEPAQSVQEFSIKLRKNAKVTRNIMRFSAGLNIEFNKWKNAVMERENNSKDGTKLEKKMPMYGAGSEFGRTAKEEAKRKKIDINQKNNPDDQPLILSTSEYGKDEVKKFKGTRLGAIAENTSYYIFSLKKNGSIEAFPLHKWYDFQPVQKYAILNDEEVEKAYDQRNSVLNYFNVMVQKRLHNADENNDLLEDEQKDKKKNKNAHGLKISEMDEWVDSDSDDSDSDSDSECDKENKNNSDLNDKTKKKKQNLKKKKRHEPNNEAFEESDDGDEEGQERGYITDSSASESELESQNEMKSVAEERGLRTLLTSDDEDDEDDEDEIKHVEDDKDDNDKNKTEESGDKIDKKKIKKESSEDKKIRSDSSSILESSNKQKSTLDIPTKATDSSANSLKRKNSSPDASLHVIKKSKMENHSFSRAYIPKSNESGITEDSVSRYLKRRPMTTVELIQKFKSKKTGLSSEELVTILTKVLQNMKPTSKRINGKTYFSVN